jgi:sialic acid synthase SpsE
MTAGQVLSKENLRAIRPGYGLQPKFYDIVLGKRVNQGVKRGTPVSWELFD